MTTLLRICKLFIITALIFSFPRAAKGEWQYLCTSEQGNQLYYDSENIVLQLLIKVTSSAEAVAEEVSRFGIKYRDKQYSLISMQVSCSSKMIRIVKFTDYDAQGVALFSGNGSQTWKAIEPESIIEKLYDTLCSQKNEELVRTSSVEQKALPIEKEKPEPYPLTPQEEKISVQEDYSVQIGAFRKIENALSISREFQNKGYDSHIYESKTDKGTLYKVLIGKYHSRTEAAKNAHEIESNEHINAIVAMNQ